MFTKKELKALQSCWILPNGLIYEVSAERHDLYLPHSFFDEDLDSYKQVEQVEKKCVRMSFYWGWDADISYMKIACTTLTEQQKQIIKYLLMADIVSKNRVQVSSRTFGKKELFTELLQ